MNSSTDINGAPVEQYDKLVLVSHQMKMLRCIIPFWCTKFQFQNEDHCESMIELRFVDILKPLNQISMNDLPSGWLIKVGDYFQPKSKNISRSGSNITEASSLLPPIIPYEELTKRGAGQNITFMLLIRGILLPIDSECSSSNILKILLVHDFKKYIFW